MITPLSLAQFKNELLMPAVAEINEETEIEVELIEHREQSTLQAVQFKVARVALAGNGFAAPDATHIGDALLAEDALHAANGIAFAIE